MQPNNQKRRILVVEDDADICELIVTRLRIAGYATTTARDGAQALEAVNMLHPAAMVLDINMPGMDGFDLLNLLQLKPITAKLPVMVLTARNAPDDVKRALELGARDFMTKPFNDQQLLARVARLLRKRKAAAPGPADADDDVVLI